MCTGCYVRLLRRPEPVPRPVERTFFYRLAKFAMRRAVPILLVGAALLIALGLPFSQAKWGLPDDRVLPESSSARQVGDQLRTDFADNLGANVTIVIRDAWRYQHRGGEPLRNAALAGDRGLISLVAGWHISSPATAWDHPRRRPGSATAANS